MPAIIVNKKKFAASSPHTDEIKSVLGTELGNIKFINDAMTKYPNANEQNTNKTWLNAIWADMPDENGPTTWVFYNSSGVEWTYFLSKRGAGMPYGSCLRVSYQGNIQVCGRDANGFSKWKQATLTELTY